MYDMSEEERTLLSSILRALLNAIENSKELDCILISGGTIRRLHLIESGMPINQNDLNALWSSDIDILVNNSDYKMADKQEEIFKDKSLEKILNRRLEIFDLYAFGEHSKLYSYIEDLVKEYNNLKQRFFTLSENLLKDMTIQCIVFTRDHHYTKKLVKRLQKKPESVPLGFDLDLNKFLFFGGELYDLRKNKDGSQLTGILSRRTYERLQKYESYGYYIPKEDYIRCIRNYLHIPNLPEEETMEHKAKIYSSVVLINEL